MKWAFLSLIMLSCAMNTVQTNQEYSSAYFAGGCFWCMEGAFEAEEGVIDAISGYSNGNVKNPSYKLVLTGTTGHKEAVEIRYNPKKISYEKLVNIFWRQIDPTDPGGQFADRGSQYTTAIFYSNEEEREIAEASKKEIAKKFDKPIATEILPFKNFYAAEEYHQDYYKKRTAQYQAYEKGSGRKDYKEKTWN